jgi:hypothetical protein
LGESARNAGLKTISPAQNAGLKAGCTEELYGAD